MFYGTDNIMLNILHIRAEYGNIQHSIVSPTKHCYGFE